MSNDGRTGILLFGLGGKEVFGINVFKVKSIIQLPEITKAPGAAEGVVGMISLRGDVIPILDMSALLGLPKPEETPLLLITEFRRRVQGFLVGSVDRIIHVESGDFRPANEIFRDGDRSCITSVVRREDDSLVSIIDVEQISSKLAGDTEIPELPDYGSHDERCVFFVDDSPFASKEIARTLDKCQIKHKSAKDGKEAWERLAAMVNVAKSEGRKITDYISLVLTDAEMPEMDGYELTKKIKESPELKDLPVIMHSSVASSVNSSLSQDAGADDYIEKFDPVHLSKAFAKYCS